MKSEIEQVFLKNDNIVLIFCYFSWTLFRASKLKHDLRKVALKRLATISDGSMGNRSPV